MLSKFRLAILIIIAVSIVSSCGNKQPKEAKYIPKDVSAVFVLDPKNMEDKLEKAGISVDTLINRMMKKDPTDTGLKKIFYSIKDSAGINWSNQLFLFATQKSGAKNGNASAINLMLSLKEKKSFETFIKQHESTSGKTIQKEKKYSYVVLSAETMLAWNEETVIGTMYNKHVKPYYDTVAMKFIVPEKGKYEAEMRAEVNTYFTQKEEASLASVDQFGKLFKDKADGYTFSSTNSYLNVLSAMPLQLPKLEELVKDNYLGATLSFEEGKIVATATTYTNPFVSNLLNRYAGPTVNLSMIEHYPSENINMILLASFNPEIFAGVLKELEVEGLVNSFMEKTGFSSKELYQSLKGDIAVIVSDLSMPEKNSKVKNDSTIRGEHQPIGKMIFSAPVGNPTSFIKIMDKGVELGYFNKQGNTYKAGKLMSFMGMYMQADEKNLIIASDSITYTQYVSNKNRAMVSNEALNLFKGKSTVAYFDIANTIKNFLNNHEGDYKNSIGSAKQVFKDMIASTENYKDGAINGKIEVRLKDEKQNSLVTLTGLFTDMATDMRIAQRKESEQTMFPSGVPAIIRTN